MPTATRRNKPAGENPPRGQGTGHGVPQACVPAQRIAPAVLPPAVAEPVSRAGAAAVTAAAP